MKKAMLKPVVKIILDTASMIEVPKNPKKNSAVDMQAGAIATSISGAIPCAPEVFL